MYTGNDKNLRNELDYLHRKIEELVVVINRLSIHANEQKNDNFTMDDTTKPGLLIGKVKDLHYVKEYDYKGQTLEQFIVTLDNNQNYFVDRRKDSTTQIENNDTISYVIDGDKLRQVRVLYSV
jgi:hypothetical protein